jgi:hypothetical protein
VLYSYRRKIALPGLFNHCLFTLFTVCLSAFSSFAQKDTAIPFLPFADTTQKIHKDSIQPPAQKDITDIIKQLFNIKSNSVKDSIRNTRDVNIAVLPAAGYSLQSKLAVLLAGNITFRNHLDSTAKISVITASVVYTQNKQILFPLQSIIWTNGEKYLLLGDWRIMKYPQDTYGLGGYSSLDSANPMDYDYLKLHETVFRQLARNFYGGIGYYYDYHWNISEEGNPGGSVSDYVKYGASEQSSSSGPVISFAYDSRRNPVNPKQGFYGDVIYRQNLTALGSDSDWGSLIVDVRKYFRFPARSKNILALWNYDWLTTSGNPPYLDLPSTSWDPYTNTGRGYIQGRFRSKNMLYFETEYRFGLTANGLLGAVVFGNLQAFSEWPSNNFETVRPAGGFGLRIKLNKQSDTNIDLDYGFGIGNSHGLTVNIAEVF